MTAPNNVPTPTSKAQAQAYRFGVRRLEYAVATGQSFRRVTGGPRHGLAFLVGLILAVLVLAGFAVFALISPEPSIGDAKVAVDSDNGGAYVVRNGRLHPALNYSSALLAAGRDTARSASGGGGGGGGGQAGGDAGSGKPKSTVVDSDTIREMPKGQSLGIAGAPNVVPGEGDLVGGSWTVCDESRIGDGKAPSSTPTLTTHVVLGQPVVPSNRTGRGAALVTPDAGTTTYVVAEGRRVEVDTTDRAVTQALGIDDSVEKRPISSGLLAAIPAGPAVAPPTITGRGQAVSWTPDVVVGDVFAVQFASGAAFYAVLSDGVERVGPVVADLIRADVSNTSKIPFVKPSVLKQAPRSSAIDLDDFPTVKPQFASVTTAPMVCLGWNGGRGRGAYSVYPATATTLPTGKKAVPAPPGAGSSVADDVFVEPGKGEVVGQVVGDQQAAAGAIFLVTDNGVKYPVVDKRALAYLGLGKKFEPAPPALVNLLPTGPVLDPSSAAAYYPERTGR